MLKIWLPPNKSLFYVISLTPIFFCGSSKDMTLIFLSFSSRYGFSLWSFTIHFTWEIRSSNSITQWDFTIFTLNGSYHFDFNFLWNSLSLELNTRTNSRGSNYFLIKRWSWYFLTIFLYNLYDS